MTKAEAFATSRSSSSEVSSLPSVLSDLRVVDLSSGISGPVAGMLLADHGADVVKVEPPGGDPLRESPGYETWLRGRRSVVLDLEARDDHATFIELVRGADVLLETFSPGVTSRLGIEPDAMRVQNPRLVSCSVTGYGTHTSLRDRPGYEALVAARTGIMHEQRGYLGSATAHMQREAPYLPDLEIPEGMEPGSARGGPIFSYTPWLSIYAALNATLGISAALLAREITGRGQHVETSLLQSALLATTPLWMRVEHSDTKLFRTWIYDRRATKGVFRCSDDRWVQCWAPNPAFVLSSADGAHLEIRRNVSRQLDDPDRIGTEYENLIVLAHYFPQLAEAFARFPSDDWARVGAEGGVPLQPVRTPEEALLDPALERDGAVLDLEHPEHGVLRQVGILYGLSATPGAVGRSAPSVGEHTAEIRGEARRARPVTPSTGTSTDGREELAAPLDGVTVVDLGFAVAGPYGTQLLADLGADVIKVNAARDPYWHQTHIAYGANRGKRSIGIDLKTSPGRSVLRRLIQHADVAHTNMRRDALDRLELDEESLRAINPDLVYVHTRGFDRGPRSDAPGNDQTGCSLAGVTYEDGGCRDGGKPFWSPTSLGDTGNGFLSAIGVVQALYHRRRTGTAQSVDTSILNAGLLCASMATLRADGSPLPRPHLDRMQLGLSPCYRLYATADRWVCLAAVTGAHRDALARVLDVERLPAAEELGRRLASWFAARTAGEAFAGLDRAGVPCEIADEQFGPNIHDDPEMGALGLVVEQHHPKLGRFEHFGETLGFSDTPQRIFGPPPVVGQHTREIMRELGFEESEIDRFVEEKAVFEELWYS